MKIPSRTVAFAILAGIMILAVVSCVTHQFVADQQALLVIGTETAGQTNYVRWKSKPQFDTALKRICDGGGISEIKILMDDLHAVPIPNYSPCPPSRSITLVKVTKSKVTNNTAASAPNDPNVVYKVASPNPEDVAAVAAALKK